jgi:outer membrane protein TolC
MSPPKEKSGPVLSIFDFLDQVRVQHQGYKANELEREAVTLYEKESHLTVQPSLFASAENSDDKKPGTLFPANETKTQTYQMGFSETTAYGLSGKLYYQATDLKYKDLVFGNTAPTSPHYLQTSPVLQLTLPLWRNLFGSETQNQLLQGDAKNAQTLHEEDYNLKETLIQAAVSYWNLVLARQSAKVAQDAVERNQQLLNWNKNRAQNGLGDKADVLQAQATLQTSLLNLKAAKDSVTSYNRAFNLARNLNSAEVSEKLMELSGDFVGGLKIPERMAYRDDIKAALDQARAAKAAAELARQQYLPTFELYTTLSLNNPDPTSTGSAYSDAFNSSRPTTTVGVRLNAPLDFGLISKVREGRNQEKTVADLTYQRKVVEQEKDWGDLVDKFLQAKDRVALYANLEEIQRKKYDYERIRRGQGRTTTQQVLYFEADLEQAQLSRIQALSDLLTTYSQMKLYEGGSK